MPIKYSLNFLNTLFLIAHNLFLNYFLLALPTTLTIHNFFFPFNWLNNKLLNKLEIIARRSRQSLQVEAAQFLDVHAAESLA
jgi:hypothetical protein